MLPAALVVIAGGAPTRARATAVYTEKRSAPNAVLDIAVTSVKGGCVLDADPFARRRSSPQLNALFLRHIQGSRLAQFDVGLHVQGGSLQPAELGRSHASYPIRPAPPRRFSVGHLSQGGGLCPGEVWLHVEKLRVVRFAGRVQRAYDAVTIQLICRKSLRAP